MKLETMLHVCRKTREGGALHQYSTESIERCHITMTKIPYSATNRKDHEKQMCRFWIDKKRFASFSFPGMVGTDGGGGGGSGGERER